MKDLEIVWEGRGLLSKMAPARWGMRQDFSPQQPQEGHRKCCKGDERLTDFKEGE